MKDTLENCSGMSDPFYFSFNIKDKGRKMLCHAVIFTSFEMVGASESTIPLCTLDRDPRMRRFVEFVWQNFLKERETELNQKVAELEREILNRKKSLTQLESEIQQLGKENK